MPAASVESVRNALRRGNPAPVYYLTGDEDVLKDELVEAIVDATVDSSTRDFNLDVRAARDLDGESLHALVETPPMLAERRVAVIRYVEQWRKTTKVWRLLQQYVADPSPTTTLILVQGAGQPSDQTLAAQAEHVSAELPDRDALREWVSGRGERMELALDQKAIDHLIEVTGASLSHIAMELDKLAAGVGEGPIGVREIEQFVGVRHGETLPDWVDAVVSRDTPRAVWLLDIVLPQPGVSGVRMVMALGTALVGARYTRALADGGRSERQVRSKLWEFLKRARPANLGSYTTEVDRWVKGARGWDTADLDAALRILYDTDQQLKSTTISDPSSTLCTMLLRLTHPTRI